MSRYLKMKALTKIQKLAKSSDDSHKGEELQVAYRFITFYNKNYGTDYILSEKQPGVHNSTDVRAHSQSDSQKEMKLQIKTLDAEARKFLDNPKKGSFLRIINQGERHPIIKSGKNISEV